MAVGCGVKSVGGCKRNCVGTGSGLQGVGIDGVSLCKK